MLSSLNDLIIRQATLEDAVAIQTIYRHYILNTSFNLEEEVPNLTVLEERIQSLSSKYPFLVAEYNDQVIGFAYLSDFYQPYLQHTALLSIYVSQESPIRGVGHELFTVLEFLVSGSTTQYILSSIVAHNTRSIHFHQKQGFDHMLTLPNFAHKAGQNIDIIWMRKAVKASAPLLQLSLFPESADCEEFISDFL